MTHVDPLLGSLPDAVVVVDATLTIADCNDAFAGLFGAQPPALTGRPLAEVANPRTMVGEPLIASGWPAAARLRGVKAIPELDVVLGDDYRARVTGTYLRASDGTLAGAVLAFRPFRRAGREPAGAEVVSTVSHELRSPLTSVKGYTSLLLNRWDRLTDDQKRLMLEQVHHDADRVTRLIGELLDISRLETGRLVLRRQLVDVVEVASRVVERLTVTYPDLDAEFVSDGEVPKAWADPDKVEQVLTNLIENAAKYASPTGLHVRFAVANGHVAVAVEDSGDGIPANDLPHIFRKFFRRDHGKPSGTGLGLWISRGLVEAHGGQLSAASVAGQGSTFRFTLPTTVPNDLVTDGD